MTSISNCSGFCDQRYLCQGVVAILMDEFIASIHNTFFSGCTWLNLYPYWPHRPYNFVCSPLCEVCNCVCHQFHLSSSHTGKIRIPRLCCNNPGRHLRVFLSKALA